MDWKSYTVIFIETCGDMDMYTVHLAVTVKDHSGNGISYLSVVPPGNNLYRGIVVPRKNEEQGVMGPNAARVFFWRPTSKQRLLPLPLLIASRRTIGVFMDLCKKTLADKPHARSHSGRERSRECLRRGSSSSAASSRTVSAPISLYWAASARTAWARKAEK